ncbi:hypothetical protein LEP1GSC073_0917 [Leptospira noguchii str. Cascata]|nr:hypothetical protein LEP1GSC072_0977 [Leptospira noguchii str. Bonito]EMS89925.1 hypothetical protein LEP1GSC073_0917 [Leptospira noguchii str. Cascata]
MPPSITALQSNRNRILLLERMIIIRFKFVSKLRSGISFKKTNNSG